MTRSNYAGSKLVPKSPSLPVPKSPSLQVPKSPTVRVHAAKAFVLRLTSTRGRTASLQALQIDKHVTLVSYLFSVKGGKLDSQY